MTTESSTLPQVSPLTRREFMYYVWGASLALFTAEMSGLLIWFALPRFKEGEFGGVFTVPVGELPSVDSAPKDFPAGRYWLSYLGPKRAQDPRQPADYAVQPGLKVIYKVCTHLGCLYKWVPTNDRFECPCHGSKFLATGARVEGPATRNLDTFTFEFVDAEGQMLATSAVAGEGVTEEGAAVPVPDGAAALRINTGDRIMGARNTQPGGGV